MAGWIQMTTESRTGVLAAWRTLGCAGLMLAACLVVNNPQQQAPVWTVPYLSGAANLRPGAGWMYDESAIDRFKAMSVRERRDTRFERLPVSALTENHYNTPFFVFVVFVARWLFFWMGDLAAVEALQVVIHVLATLAVMKLLGRPRLQVLFLLLYGLNPLVLWYVTSSLLLLLAGFARRRLPVFPVGEVAARATGGSGRRFPARRGRVAQTKHSPARAASCRCDAHEDEATTVAHWSGRRRGSFPCALNVGIHGRSERLLAHSLCRHCGVPESGRTEAE